MLRKSAKQLRRRLGPAAAVTVAAALWVGFPAASHAAMVQNPIDDLGVIDLTMPMARFSNIVPTGDFLNDFTFTLTEVTNPLVALAAEVVPTTVPPLTPPDRELDLSSMMLQVFANTGDDSMPGPIAHAQVSGGLITLATKLSPGDYFLRVVGEAVGKDGGEFVGEVHRMKPIPLPPALMLLLGGLAALGGCRFWSWRPRGWGGRA